MAVPVPGRACRRQTPSSGACGPSGALAGALVLGSLALFPAPTHSEEPPPTARAFGAIKILASQQAQPWGLALARQYVYWTNRGSGRNDGTLMRVPKDGGLIDPVAIEQVNPYAIALGDTHLYWTRYGSVGQSFRDGAIWTAPRRAGGGRLLLGGQPKPWSLAYRQKRIYWVTHDGTVATAPSGGGPVTLLSQGHRRPVGLVVDETQVYFTDSEAGTVLAVPRSGGPLRVLASGQSRPAGLGHDQGHLYWANFGDGQVKKLSKKGGTPIPLGGGPGGVRLVAPRHLHVDRADLFVADGKGGQVVQVPKDGRPSTVVASGFRHPYSVAADATHVYFVDLDGGQVVRVERPRPTRPSPQKPQAPPR